MSNGVIFDSRRCEIEVLAVTPEGVSTIDVGAVRHDDKTTHVKPVDLLGQMSLLPENSLLAPNALDDETRSLWTPSLRHADIALYGATCTLSLAYSGKNERILATAAIAYEGSLFCVFKCLRDSISRLTDRSGLLELGAAFVLDVGEGVESQPGITRLFDNRFLFDETESQIYIDSIPVKLSDNELRLLKFLLENRDIRVPKINVLASVWGQDSVDSYAPSGPTINTVGGVFRRLREKLTPLQDFKRVKDKIDAQLLSNNTKGVMLRTNNVDLEPINV